MIPTIDPNVKHQGVSELRKLTAERLREFSTKLALLVIQDGDEPLAVIVPYQLFLQMQSQQRD